MKKFFLFVFVFSLVIGLAGVSHASVDKMYEAAIVFTMGDVKVDKEADGTWIPAEIAMKLKEGAIVKTGADSVAEIVFDAEGLNLLRLEENTQVTIRKSMVELPEGSILANFANLEPGSSFTVKTPNAACGIRGSGLGVDHFAGITEVKAFEDKVYVQGVDRFGNPIGAEVIIPEGWKSAVEKGGEIEPPAELTENEKIIWDAWIEVVAGPPEEEEEGADLEDQLDTKDVSEISPSQ